MTLFIKRKNTTYIINDLYFMILAFFISYLATKAIIKISKSNNKKTDSETENKIQKFRGGANNDQSLVAEISKELGLEDLELIKAIQYCIADDKIYVVNDPRIKSLIFKVAKAKLKNSSLIISPQLIRFLGLYIFKKDKSVITKIRGWIFIFPNIWQFLKRIFISIIVGATSAASLGVMGGLALTLSASTITDPASITCSNYFTNVAKSSDTTKTINVLNDKETGLLAIAGNDDAKRIQLYVPAEKEALTVISDNKKTAVLRKYRSSRKKAKIVKFSDFQKHDPVLKAFKEEPYIPQTPSPFRGIKEEAASLYREIKEGNHLDD